MSDTSAGTAEPFASWLALVIEVSFARTETFLLPVISVFAAAAEERPMKTSPIAEVSPSFAMRLLLDSSPRARMAPEPVDSSETACLAMKNQTVWLDEPPFTSFFIFGRTRTSMSSPSGTTSWRLSMLAQNAWVMSMVEPEDTPVFCVRTSSFPHPPTVASANGVDSPAL